MRQVNIHEAKTHLSRLADEASAGETIILAKAGKPVAKIVPLEEPKTMADGTVPVSPENSHLDWSRFGFMKGKVFVADDFDTAHQEEIVKMFEGDE